MQQCQKKSLGLITLIVIFCLQFSAQDSSVAGREKPPINIYGTLIDSDEDTYTVENITINGQYKQVSFYKQPERTTTNPRKHTTRIDLTELKVITVPRKLNPDSKTQEPIIASYNNKEYIQVQLMYEDGSQQLYIIERSSLVRCDEKIGQRIQEKDLSFEAISQIKITGYKEQSMQKDENTNNNLQTTQLKKRR